MLVLQLSKKPTLEFLRNNWVLLEGFNFKLP